MAELRLLRDIATFLRDLRKSTGFCRLCMLVGVAGCVGAAIVPAEALAQQDCLSTSAWRVVLGAAAVATWLVAFALGVLARPDDNRQLVAYPPHPLLRGIWSKGLVFPVVTGVAITLLTGWAASTGLLYGLAAFGSMNLTAYVGLWLGTAATQRTIRQRRAPEVAIADSFQRVWLYYGLLLLSASWASGSMTAANGGPAIPPAALAAAMVTCAFAMGYVSGYYP